MAEEGGNAASEFSQWVGGPWCSASFPPQWEQGHALELGVR